MKMGNLKKAIETVVFTVFCLLLYQYYLWVMSWLPNHWLNHSQLGFILLFPLPLIIIVMYGIHKIDMETTEKRMAELLGLEYEQTLLKDEVQRIPKNLQLLLADILSTIGIILMFLAFAVYYYTENGLMAFVFISLGLALIRIFARTRRRLKEE